MQRGRGRLVAGLGAAAACAVVAALLAALPRMEQAWHLHSLRTDPGRFEEMLLATSAARRAAATEFILEPAGKDALARLYLSEYDRNESGMGVRDYLARLRTNAGMEGALALWKDGLNVQTFAASGGSSSFSTATVPLDPRRREAILELLPRIDGVSFTAPGFDGYEFQVRPASGGERTFPPQVTHACFFHKN
jgi:hypothetical protein